MRVIMDAHIHSKYSKATSQAMSIRTIAQYAGIKGLTLVGTGDFTHPNWLRELKENLVKTPESGFYTINSPANYKTLFMLTAEVHTIFEFEGKIRKIHHVIWSPNLEVVEQVNAVLSKYGSLEADGRPTLQITPPELVEVILGVSPKNVIFPAHAWTPWFSLFGAFSGFDRLEDCYQDMSCKIFALETGLSSNPPMNWRLSNLDRLTLVSNSDSHSYWPWRLGREANVLELNELSYHGVVEAVRSKDPNRFLFTIETNPTYGKYHWSGHRRCEVSMPASEAIAHQGICPVCGRRMTKGVEQRIEELADRPAGFKPKNVPSYVHLLPLSEIIASTVGVTTLGSRKVWDIYNLLIAKFGSEYTVLLDTEFKSLCKAVDPRLAGFIIRVREDRMKIIPGYDGVYGKLEAEDAEEAKKQGSAKQKNKVSLNDFM